MDTFLTLLTAVASAVAAIFAAKYALEAVKATRASLFGKFLEEYTDDKMGTDMERLRRWKRTYGDDFHEEYLQSLLSESPSEEAREIKLARRRVSQYFKKLARLSDANLVDNKTLAKLYGASPFEFCLNVLAPLDDANHRYVRLNMGATPGTMILDGASSMNESMNWRNSYTGSRAGGW